MPWIRETKSFEEWRSNLICLSQCVRTIIVNVMWKCIESCRLVGFGLASFLTCILFDSMQMGSLRPKKYIWKNGANVRTYPFGTLHIVYYFAHWILGASSAYSVYIVSHTLFAHKQIFEMLLPCTFNVISSISCLSCVNYIRTMFRFGCVFSYFDEITLYLAE